MQQFRSRGGIDGERVGRLSVGVEEGCKQQQVSLLPDGRGAPIASSHSLSLPPSHL